MSLIKYKYLELIVPQISTRSYLYQLQPIKTDGLLTESLTSFIGRIAESHAVSTGSLISHVIAKTIQKKYLFDGQSQGLHKICNRVSAINGLGLMALDWVNAIESLTLVSQLHELTLLNFSDVLPFRNLLRQNRAWCPLCYEDWFLKGQIVYEPLSWVLDTVKICHQHCSYLVTVCPHCERQMPWLDWVSKPGYCSKCNQWLGSYSKDELKSGLTEEKFKWEAWVSNNVASLISSNLLKPQKQVVSYALSKCIELVTEGNVAEFARMLHLPKNTVWLWKAGRNLPSLERLLRICYLIQISPVNFLANKIPSKKPNELLALSSESSVISRPPSRFFDLNKVALLLEKELLSHKYPPRPAKEIAEHLGYNIRLLREYYPELCSAISKKYSCYRKARHLKRVESLCREIQAAAFELHIQGVYPTRTNVAARLIKPGCFRELAARNALSEAHRLLGLS